MEVIRCPRCTEEIQVATALKSRIEAEVRHSLAAETQKQQADFALKEQRLVQQLASVELQKHALEQDYQKKLLADRVKLESEAKEHARQESAVQMQQLQKELHASKLKEAEFTQQQALLTQKQQALEADRKQMETQFDERLNEERRKLYDKIKQDTEHENSLKVGAKDLVIKGLSEQIAQLQRKLESSTQILQGEVLELQVEDELRKRFPRDYIEAVPRGEHGGDILHHIYDELGRKCGSILWETKRTKNWQSAWLTKLRGDQRAAKADLAVIVSIELPKGMTHFGYEDDIWVTDWSCMHSLATALRSGLIQAAQARLSSRGRQTDLEKVHDYLTGSEFQHRIKSLVESHNKMKEVLRLEQNYIRRSWAEREKQLGFMLDGAIGMVGDLRGIIGSSMPMIDQEIHTGLLEQEGGYSDFDQPPTTGSRPSKIREERIHRPTPPPPVSSGGGTKTNLFGEYGD